MSYPEGVDVSLHNQVTGHTLNGLAFAFAKASQRTFRDPLYVKHLALIQDNGLIAGAYHFLTPTPGGAAQARAFLNYADTAAILALDVEGPALHVAHTVGKSFVDEVRKWDKRPLVLYSSQGTWPGDLGQDANWVARWGTAIPTIPWLFWQYTGTGLDRDRFNGTIAELHAFAANEPDPVTPEVDDVSFNIAPLTTHRDAVVKAGSVLYTDSGLAKRHSVTTVDTPLGFVGSTGTAHVVANAGNTNYVHREDVLDIVDNERTFA